MPHPPRSELKRPASAVEALEVEATEAAKHTHALSTKKRKHMQLRWDEEALEKEKAVLELRRAAIKGNFKEFNEILEKLDKETAVHALIEDKRQLCIDMFIGAYHSLKQNTYHKEEFIKALRQCKNLNSDVMGRRGTAIMTLYARNGEKEDDDLKTIKLDSRYALSNKNCVFSSISSPTSAVENLQGERMQSRVLAF